MTGKDIPLVTWYRSSGKRTITFKKPKYELKTEKEIKDIQEKLGDLLGCYFGTLCKKCCGVYPAYMKDDDFAAKGYYVCLVCGKESTHEYMTHMARNSWNDGRYKWTPSEYRQLSIFDFEESEEKR